MVDLWHVTLGFGTNSSICDLGGSWDKLDSGRRWSAPNYPPIRSTRQKGPALLECQAFTLAIQPRHCSHMDKKGESTGNHAFTIQSYRFPVERGQVWELRIESKDSTPITGIKNLTPHPRNAATWGESRSNVFAKNPFTGHDIHFWTSTASYEDMLEGQW